MTFTHIRSDDWSSDLEISSRRRACDCRSDAAEAPCEKNAPRSGKGAIAVEGEELGDALEGHPKVSLRRFVAHPARQTATDFTT